MNIIYYNFKFIRKYRNDKLVVVVDCIFEFFFLKFLRVLIVFKERRREIIIYNDWIYWYLNNYVVKCFFIFKNVFYKKIFFLSKYSCVVEMNVVFLIFKFIRG